MNRIDETIVFRALNKDDMKHIVTLLVKELKKRCKEQLDIELTVRDSANPLSWTKPMTENMAQDLLNENFRRRLKTVCQRILLPAKLSAAIR